MLRNNLLKRDGLLKKCLKLNQSIWDFWNNSKKTTDNRFEIIPPTQDIDDFWHQHILNTFKYEKDCLEFLGFFLHHYPHTDSCIQDYVIQEKAKEIWESKGKPKDMYNESIIDAELILKQELAMLNRFQKFELMSM